MIERLTRCSPIQGSDAADFGRALRTRVRALSFTADAALSQQALIVKSYETTASQSDISPRSALSRPTGGAHILAPTTVPTMMSISRLAPRECIAKDSSPSSSCRFEERLGADRSTTTDNGRVSGRRSITQ